PTHAENIAKEGVGLTGEVDARDRDTRVRRINGDDRLINLEITILVINEGRPVGSNVGAADRPAKDPLRVQAPLAIAPVKTVVIERLRTAVGKVDGAAANRRRRAVAGRGEDIQRT